MTAVAAGRYVPALAFALFVLPAGSAFAFDMEAQMKCSDDAFRLCSSEIPDVERITACMKQRRDQVSADCRSVMDRNKAAASRAQDTSPGARQRR
ncbi:hypothetical protein [Bradyrhizobium sp. LHD-71]|uniref:hypothetical protein n=1 Tax=Bradyrhizobium sp. LHD-71 TaxID=3072141 RepID=UPI00280F117A|nr:hypothetical protein [Bradyrhizobium sp. LHD-71]MDQ8730127.1 hypothetical protein [Bradyrhizobium sp. LHD-71]